ncbi:hypothetical protein GCM10022279_22500 [Comamonas faecalis]|uniref:SPASM domain-containing protein n=1 Tax=Comamonas faecalis TaxID=1387849 RepID=A0ABP7RJ17_9BURK
MMPAMQQKAAIEARAAGHAGSLDKVRNAECGFLLHCPKGCPAKATSAAQANTRRATGPAALAAIAATAFAGQRAL